MSDTIEEGEVVSDDVDDDEEELEEDEVEEDDDDRLLLDRIDEVRMVDEVTEVGGVLEPLANRSEGGEPDVNWAPS